MQQEKIVYRRVLNSCGRALAQVLELLTNYTALGYQIQTDVPVRPPGGTLWFYHRQATRFRKDGHAWALKKGGKAVRETHEKLRVGGVEVVTCNYVYGEADSSFQRRCYWLIAGEDVRPLPPAPAPPPAASPLRAA